MASSAIYQLQDPLLQSLAQIQSRSVEIAAMNTKIDFLNTDHIQKDGQIADLLSVNRQLTDDMQRQGGSQLVGRGHTEVRLIDMKAINPKRFDGKIDSP